MQLIRDTAQLLEALPLNFVERAEFTPQPTLGDIVAAWEVANPVEESRAYVLEKYAHLRRVTQHDSLIVAAANIRTELKAAFRGIKFSVRSRSFSMGDAIDIRWSQGPTTKEVDAIANKYQKGDFDGMDDLYRYRRTAFIGLFGGTKYVQTRRDFPEDVYQLLYRAIAALEGLVSATQWQPACKGGEPVGTVINQILSATAFKPGDVITGLERVPDSPRAFRLSDYYRVVTQ